MARMNQTAPITGRPRERKEDTHTSAVREAHESGLAAWALANGFVNPDGSAMVHTAAQRRAVERAMEAATSSTHTPGPWRIFSGYGHEYIYDQEGRTEYASEAIAVAYQGSRTDKATSKANARLIAAAPDLLAALVTIRDSPQFRDRLENSVQQVVYAAIARAEGR